jgi:hypothetical protein
MAGNKSIVQPNSILNVGHLSPYHQRVEMEREYLKKKEKLRSILIMGNLQKM